MAFYFLLTAVHDRESGALLLGGPPVEFEVFQWKSQTGVGTLSTDPGK